MSTGNIAFYIVPRPIYNIIINETVLSCSRLLTWLMEFIYYYYVWGGGPAQVNPALGPFFRNVVSYYIDHWKKFVSFAVSKYIPVPACGPARRHAASGADALVGDFTILLYSRRTRSAAATRVYHAVSTNII